MSIDTGVPKVSVCMVTYSHEQYIRQSVEPHYTNVYSAPVHIGRHVIIGSGSIVLPGVMLGEGACVGSLSLVNKGCSPLTINGGIPARFSKNRHRGLEEKYTQCVQVDSQRPSTS